MPTTRLNICPIIFLSIIYIFNHIAEDYTQIPPEEYTLYTLFHDIDTLRAAISFEKFEIMGHSILGAVAYEYEIRFPEHVSHVIMIGTPNITGPEANDAANRYWANASEERIKRYEENMANIIENLKKLTQKETLVKIGWAERPKRSYEIDYDATAYYESMILNFDLVEHLLG